jgi:hypothetical protein
MRVLKQAGIIGPENRAWRNVAEHSLVVNATSMMLAQKLKDAGMQMDVGTVDTASMLHDVAKRLDSERGVSFATEHSASKRQEFLAGCGYSAKVIASAGYSGRVPEIFITDPAARQVAIASMPLGHLVIAYADARIRNTEVVSLETARDLNKVKVPADEALYDQWYAFYQKVEERLFGAINEPEYTPGSVSNESVIAFIGQVAS